MQDSRKPNLPIQQSFNHMLADAVMDDLTTILPQPLQQDCFLFGCEHPCLLWEVYDYEEGCDCNATSDGT